jgi:hypothetical protein
MTDMSGVFCIVKRYNVRNLSLDLVEEGFRGICRACHYKWYVYETNGDVLYVYTYPHTLPVCFIRN